MALPDEKPFSELVYLDKQEILVELGRLLPKEKIEQANLSDSTQYAQDWVESNSQKLLEWVLFEEFPLKPKSKLSEDGGEQTALMLDALFQDKLPGFPTLTLSVYILRNALNNVAEILGSGRKPAIGKSEDSSEIPFYFEESFRMLQCAYPNGVPEDDYEPLFRLLFDGFSEERLGEFISLFTDYLEFEAVHKAIHAYNDFKELTNPEVARIKDKLKACGYDAWLESL